MAEEQPDDKSLMIYGRDVSKIPCFRNSFLYGTLGGLGFGLAHFMFTSRVAKSVNYSVYSFSMFTVSYWMYCRYNFSKTKFEMLRTQEALRAKALKEGTADDPFRQAELEGIEV
ncbi:unnamed protein product [Ceutorhynchus assimilis]|uniref:Cytochrome c oxidase assembly protein COX20, mitochondrial n=1 Tax=Ceutorhynchus assimilis TaxID=467358 RepID=A0A9N9QJ09_9CUCU|nr:unnamed protein product [Ceutorhynchus assimilis]